MNTHVFGSYRPAYWRIKIHTKEDLTRIWGLSDEDQATYFHEYTHFLQDITSTFGLNFSWSTLDRLRQVVKTIQHGDTELHLPIRNKIALEQIQFGRSFQSFWGDYDLDHDDGLYSINSLSLPADKLLSELTGSNISKVILKLENGEGRKREYVFGANAIHESLAQMIQGKFSTTNLSNQFPYIAAVKLAQFVHAEVAENAEWLFAACDFATMSPFPGWHFYILLLELKMRKKKIEKAEEIYQFGFELFSERNWNFMSEYCKAKNGLITVINDIFGDREQYQATKKWFIYILEHAYQLRVQQNYIMLDLFRTKPYEGIWNELVIEIGMPEVINDNNIRWMQTPLELRHMANEIEPSHLLALWQLNDMLLAKSKIPCLLKNACSGSIYNNIINDDCDISPWNKAYIDKSCPFGFLWKHFGLDEKAVVVD